MVMRLLLPYGRQHDWVIQSGDQVPLPGDIVRVHMGGDIQRVEVKSREWFFDANTLDKAQTRAPAGLVEVRCAILTGSRSAVQA